MTDASAVPTLRWLEDGKPFEARWRSHAGSPPPTRVVVADRHMTADQAYGLACQGTALLWRGDFHEARRLLAALGKRADQKQRRRRPTPSPEDITTGAAHAFHRHRQARAQRTRTLNALLIPFDDHYAIPLPQAPDVRQACTEAWGNAEVASVAPLRALLGVIGAHEWRTRGIEIPEAGGRIHPHFGVFAPIRREYIDLVDAAPLPRALETSNLAFDIGTGTGVLAAILARRGVERVVATDVDPRALVCARENLDRLGYSPRVDVVQAELFPEGRAALAVCNPPWVPARPSSPLESAVYDPDSRMLRGFLAGLSTHLVPGGEGWLILSDLAEHLGLRSREELLAMIAGAGLEVLDRHDVAPRHERAADESDPLHEARAAEVTSLWRLAPPHA